MVGDPKPIQHPVKFFEKGDKPLEIVSTRQWYIRNGGRDESIRARLIELGREQTVITATVNGVTGHDIRAQLAVANVARAELLDRGANRRITIRNFLCIGCRR